METEPVLVALLFADNVIVEASTNKRTIVGAFSELRSARFPAVFPPWWIYAAVDNVAGSVPYALNLVSDETDQVVVGISGDITVQDGPRGVEMQVRIPNAVFPSPGRYNLSLSLGGERVGGRVLRVSPVRGADAPAGER